MPFSRLLLLCACLTLATGLAAARVPEVNAEGDAADAARAEATMQAYQAWQRRAAAALAVSGGARDLALAAQLLQLSAGPDATADDTPDDDTPSRDVPVDARIATWRQQAAARAGGDVLVEAMLAGSAGTQSPDVGKTAAVAAAARWRTAEPDNLAPLLFSDVDADVLLDAASRTSRFDLHYYDLTRVIATALRRQLPGPAERALLEPDTMSDDEFVALMASAMMASSIPSLTTLIRSCRDPALDATPGRRDDCQHAAETLRDRSDTQLGESLGLGMMRGLAVTPAEVAAADARGRQFAWRMQQWREIAARQPRGGLGEFARLVADPSIERESQLVDRVITGAGAPLTPPAGWEPQRPR